MNIAIIGAGPAELAAAYDLAKAGAQDHHLRGRAEVGGLAAGFQEPGWDWSLEKFYHHWFYTDEECSSCWKRWAREIGGFEQPITSLWHEGKNYPMDKPVTPIALSRGPINVLGCRA